MYSFQTAFFLFPWCSQWTSCWHVICLYTTNYLFPLLLCSSQQMGSFSLSLSLSLFLSLSLSTPVAPRVSSSQQMGCTLSLFLSLSLSLPLHNLLPQELAAASKWDALSLSLFLSVSCSRALSPPVAPRVSSSKQNGMLSLSPSHSLALSPNNLLPKGLAAASKWDHPSGPTVNRCVKQSLWHTLLHAVGRVGSDTNTQWHAHTHSIGKFYTYFFCLHL